MSPRVSISIQVIESPAEGIRLDYIRRHISTSGSPVRLFDSFHKAVWFSSCFVFFMNIEAPCSAKTACKLKICYFQKRGTVIKGAGVLTPWTPRPDPPLFNVFSQLDLRVVSLVCMEVSMVPLRSSCRNVCVCVRACGNSYCCVGNACQSTVHSINAYILNVSQRIALTWYGKNVTYNWH